ncbi:MAG: hypothetical protein ACO1OC_12465 [Tuberibacillus sp.]
MLIIVWLSIALVVVSLIWLVIIAVKEARRIKDNVIRCSKSAEILRKDSEAILKKNEKLQETTGKITADFEQKRQDVDYLKDQGQALVHTIKDSKEQFVDAYHRLRGKAEV